MKALRELRLTVFHSQHIKNITFRHALTKGIGLSGEPLPATSLSINVASVNQTILSVHSVKYTESSYRLLVGASTMKRKILRLTGGESTPREIGNIPNNPYKHF